MVERLIRRADGTEIKIVAQACFGHGLHRSFEVHVLRRVEQNSNWNLCSNRPHPNWREMTVDEYIAGGRSEMLQAASISEILVTIQLLNKLESDL